MIEKRVNEWLWLHGESRQKWDDWRASIPTMSESERHERYDHIEAEDKPMHELESSLIRELDGTAFVTLSNLVVYEHVDQGAVSGFLTTMAVYKRR